MVERTMIKILIVDDEKPICDLIDINLSAGGYYCKTVQDGLKALDMIETEIFDLILLDLMLPGISGEELVGIFSQKTPVIVLSAKSGLDSKVDVLSAGAEDYLCKPFDLQELLVRIQVQLRRKDRESGSGRDSEPENTVYQYRQWKLNPDTLEMTAAGEPVTLTKHEFLILELLIRKIGRASCRERV